LSPKCHLLLKKYKRFYKTAQECFIENNKDFFPLDANVIRKIPDIEFNATTQGKEVTSRSGLYIRSEI